jgi:hypothetical protein
MAALTSVPRREGGSQVLRPLAPSVQVMGFLERHGLAVLDVVAGAAENGRRLFLGRPDSVEVTHVVATYRELRGAGDGGDPVEAERLVLEYANDALREGLRPSLPSVLHRVDVQGRSNGLAMTAVPGLGVPGRRTNAATRDLAAAMPGWLAAVWSDTAQGTAPVSLGEEAVRIVAGPGLRSGPSDPALEVLRRARERVAGFDVRRTLTHGCLCFRHVVIAGGSVVGVDDWGRGDRAGDPLRDLGRLAINVAGDRLPEVLAGRTSFAASVRQLMGEAMAHAKVSARLWREVLALSQLELAVEARLHGDPYGMVRLSHAVRALQGPERTR